MSKPVTRGRWHPGVRMVLKRATIDAGLAPLVRWLNSLPYVLTLYSCEGSPNDAGYDPFVTLYCWRACDENEIRRVLRKHGGELRRRSGGRPEYGTPAYFVIRWHGASPAERHSRMLDTARSVPKRRLPPAWLRECPPRPSGETTHAADPSGGSAARVRE